MSIKQIIDIALVVLILFQLFKTMRGTKGIFLMNGIVILFLAYVLSTSLELKYLSTLLNWIMLMLIVALPIIFQNELRRALEVLGQRNPLVRWFLKPTLIPMESLETVVETVECLSGQKTGALIVFEREDPLPSVIESGSYLDAVLSKILIEQIFYVNSPLHDGAALIKGNRVQAAGCFLPLNNELPLPQELGSRHRAALSLATLTDALVVVVSEETGGISLAYSGLLTTGYNGEQLRQKLRELIESQPTKHGPDRISEYKAEVEP